MSDRRARWTFTLSLLGTVIVLLAASLWAVPPAISFLEFSGFKQKAPPHEIMDSLARLVRPVWWAVVLLAAALGVRAWFAWGRTARLMGSVACFWIISLLLLGTIDLLSFCAHLELIYSRP